MKSKLFTALIFFLFYSFATYAENIKIDIENEIDLLDGSYLAKEFQGQGRYALINHSHGRFEGENIANASCSDGIIVQSLPNKYNKIQKKLQSKDYIFLKCKEN